MAEPQEMRVDSGPDGRPRCWWSLGAPELIEYHDRQWGRPLHGERELFEMLTLESFQSGLSWLTILRKREGFRRAFGVWDLERIAAYGDRDVERLLGDAGIVRNRAKIEATIANARATVTLHREGETLDDLLWTFAPDPGASDPPASGHDLESTTAESKAMAKELKRRGFRFVGPTTAYSLMEAAGMVNDHLTGCSFRSGQA
jgi:DNA-3-methyladenine glycosylase I